MHSVLLTFEAGSVFVIVNCPVSYRMLGNIPGFDSPVVTNKKCLWMLPNFPGVFVAGTGRIKSGLAEKQGSRERDRERENRRSAAAGAQISQLKQKGDPALGTQIAPASSCLHFRSLCPSS